MTNTFCENVEISKSGDVSSKTKSLEDTKIWGKTGDRNRLFDSLQRR